MNFYTDFKNKIIHDIEGLVSEGHLPDGLSFKNISVDPPKDIKHGDLATNAAMVLAKPSKTNPRELATLLKSKIEAYNEVDSIEIAGPGFINFHLKDNFWHLKLKDLLVKGNKFGLSEIGKDKNVNVEFVSVNPTGPLHVAHARGAVFGDALSNLLKMAGFNVTKEYYINDAGNQVLILAKSLYHRYQELLGMDVGEIKEGFYPGEYLIDVAQKLLQEDGDKWLNKSEDEWLDYFREFAVNALMSEIKKDLRDLGVEFDVFFSEYEMVQKGAVDLVEQDLKDKDLLYTGVLEPPKGKVIEDWEERPQLLFKSSEFGDDVDRPLQKSDGSWTYFASDIAYHLDKFKRGYQTLINVWGADHGGYVKRMQAAVKAITSDKANLDVKLCQMVRILNDGQMMRMSKRAGNFVTLRDLIHSVGKDVIRFIMLTRKNDQHLDFDIVQAQEQSKDNPIFYVQYANARCHSVLRYAAEQFTEKELENINLAEADFSQLTDETEFQLIKILVSWPRILENAALSHEPHRIAFYLTEVASLFHTLWNKGKSNEKLRFLLNDNKELTLARLALIKATITVLSSGLSVFSILPVEEMN